MPTTLDLLFVASKVLVFLEQPINWILTLLVGAVVLTRFGRPRAAQRVLITATVLLGIVGYYPLPEYIIQRLENLYPPVDRSPGAFEGVIVLGGGIDGGLRPLERGQTSLNASAERFTTALVLARRFPALKIVLTGLSAELQARGLSEAEAAARFFDEQGVPRSRVLLDEASRNTYEIAVNVKRLPTIDATRPWLVLTSAWNMPRALGAFRKAGWNAHPLPVDYETGTSIDYVGYSVRGGSHLWARVIHEVGGIAVYWLTGRI